MNTDMSRRIFTMDGGSDHLLPGRWRAFVNPFVLEGDIKGHGLTEQEAVKDLRRLLSEKYPLMMWIGDMPYVQVYPVDHREEGTQ